MIVCGTYAQASTLARSPLNDLKPRQAPSLGSQTATHQLHFGAQNTATIKITAKADGLLIFAVKQHNFDVIGRLSTLGSSTNFIDSQLGQAGSEYLMLEVSKATLVTAEVIFSESQTPPVSISATSTFVAKSNPHFANIRTSYRAMTKAGELIYLRAASDLSQYKRYTEQAIAFYQSAAAGFEQLYFTHAQQTAQLSLALELINLERLEQAKLLLDNIIESETSSDGEIKMLAIYIQSLNLRQYYDEKTLFEKLGQVRQLAQSLGLKQTLQNSRIDECSIHYQKYRDAQAERCFLAILDEDLLINSPLQMAVTLGNVANLYQVSKKHNLALTYRVNALVEIEKLAELPSYKLTYRQRKSILKRQQARHLMLLGLSDNALSVHLSSLIFFEQTNNETFYLDTLLDLATIYFEHSQIQLAKLFASEVYQASHQKESNDKIQLQFVANLLLMKINFRLHNTELAQHHRQQARELAAKNPQQLLALDVAFANARPEKPLRQQRLLKQLLKRATALKAAQQMQQIGVELLKINDLLGQYDQSLTTIEQLEDSQISDLNTLVELKSLTAKALIAKQQLPQALQVINHAIETIETQHQMLDNLGLKRSYRHRYKTVYAIKTQLLVQLFQRTKQAKYLWQASELNRVHSVRSAPHQASVASQQLRLDLAKKISLFEHQYSNSTLSKQPLANSFLQDLLSLENIKLNKGLDFKPPHTQQHPPARMHNFTLHYVLSSPQSFVFVINQDKISLKILPNEQRIGDATTTFIEALTSQQIIAPVLAVELAQMLLPQQILRPDNDAPSELTVLPGGVLWQLPFNLLPLTQNPDWNEPLLLDHYIISYGTNPSAAPKQARPKINNILVVSDPVYSSLDPRAPSKVPTNSAPNINLPRLKSTLNELSAVKQSFSAKRIISLTGLAATKQNFIHQLAQHNGIVHFASHGFADTSERRSAGLYFARFNEQGEQVDNLLSIYEIEQLNINATLVVLSACQTSLGKAYYQQQSDSLASAFLRGGAQQVIATQWQVPSRSTARLLKQFYLLYSSQPLSFSEALRQAQLQLRATRSPFYWAGFSLYKHRLNNKINNQPRTTT